MAIQPDMVGYVVADLRVAGRWLAAKGTRSGPLTCHVQSTDRSALKAHAACALGTALNAGTHDSHVGAQLTRRRVQCM